MKSLLVYIYTLLEDGTVEITMYTGKATELEVPSKLDGYVVTSIGKGAFSGCDNLSSITLPEGLKSIGKGAFSGCDSNLTIMVAPGRQGTVPMSFS